MIAKYMASTGDIVGGNAVRIRQINVGETAGGAATVTIDLDTVQVAPIINVLQGDYTEVTFPGPGLKADNLALANCKVLVFFDKDVFGS
jgi:hypothetical protein